MTEVKEKIAIYVPSMRGGGAEKVMVTLANQFAEKKISVDLVLANAEGPFLEEVATPVRVIDLESSRVMKSLPGLLRYLRREKPDAILAAMAHANVVAILAKILSLFPTRLVITEHINWSIAQEHEGSIRQRALRLLMRATYNRAHRIVAVSAGVADDVAAIARLPRFSIDVVYNPVVTKAIRVLSEEQPDDPCFAYNEPPLILGVGRLEEQKGFTDLIKAFIKIYQRLDCRLMILGEGSLRSELERNARLAGIEDKILLPGFVDNPYPYMRHSSVFVLSSGWEGLPSVLIQAMACGTPVVSTNCPSGPDEILESGKWGRLVPVGDVEAMAEAIAATLDQSEHPDVKSRAASFGVNSAVDAYLRMLLPNSDLEKP